MKRNLLLAVAIAGIFTLTTPSTNAAEPALSPKAKALADSLKTVPGTGVDNVDRSIKLGSPKAIAQAESLRVVSSTRTAVASAGYQATGSDGITASPKYRQQLDERAAHVMVAPLK